MITAIVLIFWLSAGFLASRTTAVYWECEYGEGTAPEQLLIMGIFLGPLCIPAALSVGGWTHMKYALVGHASYKEQTYYLDKPRNNIHKLFLVGMSGLPTYIPHGWNYPAYKS